ncbi:hypothetical protein ID867_24475 [Streptomyces parvulus]|nr:hypothetical protein [Streptomyces parvulus]
MIAVTRDDKPLQPPASLDVIVNNAGYTLAGPFEELDDAGAARTDFRASWASRLPRQRRPPRLPPGARRAGRAPPTPRHGRSAPPPVRARPSSPSPIASPAASSSRQ